MIIKFKPGETIVCKNGDWSDTASDGEKTVANVFPKQDHIYTVSATNPNGHIQLKEIPSVQNGKEIYWTQDAFEKLVEQKSEEKVRYVVVEVDKKVKEKREEIIFNN